MSEPAKGPISPPERCEECGFVANTITVENAADTVRKLGRRYQAPLTRLLPGEDGADVLHTRPNPDTWSALEYAAHVRDLIALWGSTLYAALTEDRPHFPLPDPNIADRFAAEQSYNQQDPSTVAQQLSANADRMAAKVKSIGPDQWVRTAIIGEEELTALAIVRKVAHEGGHHLLDIGRSLRAARDRLGQA